MVRDLMFLDIRGICGVYPCGTCKKEKSFYKKLIYVVYVLYIGGYEVD